jgi:hypothetical protein
VPEVSIDRWERSWMASPCAAASPCPEALRLDDVMETNGLVLFSLDVADYPHATRKVASWVLLGLAG